MTVRYVNVCKGNNIGLKEGFIALANISVVFTDDGPMMFDVGHHCNRLELLNGLKRLDLTPDDISAVFMSHLHFDHVNNIDLFEGKRVYVSRAEWEYTKKPHPDDMFVPWMIREQLAKYDVQFLDGELEISNGVMAIPTPGHTPGCYSLVLQTADKGTVVLAGDAIKNLREAIEKTSAMPFDSIEACDRSISKILDLADVIVPGHFPELYRKGDVWTFKDYAELPLVVK